MDITIVDAGKKGCKHKWSRQGEMRLRDRGRHRNYLVDKYVCAVDGCQARGYNPKSATR